MNGRQISTLSVAALSLCFLTVCAAPDYRAPDAALAHGEKCIELKSGNYDRTVVVGGGQRSYRLHVSSMASDQPAKSLVIVFHGGGQSGPRIQELIHMDEVADRHGFWVAYPNGTPGSGGGFTWNGGDCCGAAMRENIDDVEFIEGMIDELTTTSCVNPERIFATGISNGAIFSYRLGCELSDKVAAIAPVAGALMLEQCRPGKPVPAIIFHGSEDKHVKIRGGRHLMSGARRAFPPQRETRNRWLEVNGCSSDSEVVFASGDSSCRAYQNCSASGDVTFCMIEGGGHTWPGGEPIRPGVLGYTTDDLSASETMWAFFDDHPLADTKE